MNKLIGSVKEAIEKAGLKDGLTLLFWQRPVQMRWETAAENTARQPAVLWDTHFLTRCMQTR